MLKKTIAISAVALSLASCDQNVSGTIYVRDIQDVLSSLDPKGIPVDVNIEILETGLAKQCSTPDGQKMVEAVAAVFEKAALVGCEKIEASMNDRMMIKATTQLVGHASPENLPLGKYLLHFDAIKGQDGKGTFLVVRYNRDQYEKLLSQLQSINMMAQPKIEDATVSLVLHNDQRESVHVQTEAGLFINGSPYDLVEEDELGPRQELTIKLGDVKTAGLAQNSWAGIATVGTAMTD